VEILVASAIAVMTAAGVYLILRGRTFPVILGMTFLSYAADPLPQGLVLTAIVISFGMTALIVVMALRGFLESGSDRVDLETNEADAGVEGKIAGPRS
jgi:multicomponent K+:H+ antiporter subunit C